MEATKKLTQAPSSEATTEAVQRHMTAVETAVKELLCAISLELPVDPVTAEDGRIYEREAIAAHIASQCARALRSPVTNEPMGPRLFPAKQVRNLIDIVVRSGAITGDITTRWTERIDDEKVVARLRRKAEDGDAGVMHSLGDWYFDGKRGLAVDYAEAFRWYKRAADLHHVEAIAWAGHMLANGLGVAMNKTHGVALTTRAAEMGSDFAVYLLGMLFASGEDGLPQDDAQATYWLSKVVNGDCRFKHLHEDNLQEAAALLEMISARTRGCVSTS